MSSGSSGYGQASGMGGGGTQSYGGYQGGYGGGMGRGYGMRGYGGDQMFNRGMGGGYGRPDWMRGMMTQGQGGYQAPSGPSPYDQAVQANPQYMGGIPQTAGAMNGGRRTDNPDAGFIPGGNQQFLPGYVPSGDQQTVMPDGSQGAPNGPSLIDLIRMQQAQQRGY
jgi:hypothetical protein